ncbi:MAG TPA: hypothetical protein VNM87_00975, partial [Candidatus Udaeobacter sp.]|nr:hypothetical protein [Candidatus Udaeobacter sp.]
MEMKHGLHLQQKPTLVMTQRLQQALKLLQVPTLELQQILQTELQQNPLLEEVIEYDEVEEPAADTEPAEAPPEVDPERETTVQDEGEKSLAEWEEYWREGYDGHYNRGEVQTADDFYEKVPTTVPTLADYLTAQLRLATSDAEILRIGEYLIGTIDDRGYLTMADAEVADALSAPGDKVQETVAVLQTFDPPGVAAHDLRECLLLQLRLRQQSGSLAYQIVDREFEHLKERRYHEIAR